MTLAEQGQALAARARAEEQRERDQAAAITALRAQVSELERRLAQSRSLEARIDEREGQVRELAALRAQNAELEAKLQARETGAEQGHAKSLRAKAKRPATASTLGQSDDLKRIRGVGPAFERALIARGVRSFSQIAAWTASEVEEVARALRVKPERIRKEDWVGRASALLVSAGKE